VSIALPAAVFAGVLIAIQVAIIGALGERMHPFVAATWVHVGGAAFGLVAVLLVRLGVDLPAIRQAPWGLFAGVAGMLLVTGMAVAVSGLGLASTLAIVTGVQLLVGFGLEATGVIGRTVVLDPLRVGGALLIVVGVYVVVSRGQLVS
jgi:bacterial/archaeal transporter family-2 protein